MSLRLRWIAASLAVAALATTAIMLAGGYYRGPQLLATQLPALALPIAAPLALASLVERGRARLWTVALLILAAGWGYVAWVDSRPDRGGGASLAALIGWTASATALVVVVVALVVGALIRARR